MKLMTNLVSGSAGIFVMRKVKFCAFFCGSRFGDGFLVECIVSEGGRTKEQKRNRKGTLKEYENYDKIGVGIDGTFGHEKGEILCVFLWISFW